MIDDFTQAHGNSASFSGYQGGSITGADLKSIRDSYGKRSHCAWFI